MDSDEILSVLKAQSGDRSAMTAVLRAVEAPLLRYVRSLTSDADLAADIVQNTLVLIYRKLGGLSDARLFRAWTYRIASREAFRRLARERVHAHAQIEEAEGVAHETDEPLDRLSLAKLPEILGEVSPASRAVLVLHYLEGMKLNEITEVLGITLGTVKSRLGYGLKTLRQRFNQI